PICRRLVHVLLLCIGRRVVRKLTVSQRRPSARVRAAALDPILYPLFEHIERNRTAEQDEIVECANVEALAEATLRLIAQGPQPQLADLVCKRLRRPGDITLELGLDVMRRERRILGEARACAFDVPAE